MLQPEKLQAYLNDISEHRLPAEDWPEGAIFFHLWALAAGYSGHSLWSHLKEPWLPFLATPSLQPQSHVLLLNRTSFAVVGLGYLSAPAKEPVAPVPNTHHPPIKCLRTWLKHWVTRNCVAQKTLFGSPIHLFVKFYHLLNLKHLEDIHRFSLGRI